MTINLLPNNKLFYGKCVTPNIGDSDETYYVTSEEFHLRQFSIFMIILKIKYK